MSFDLHITAKTCRCWLSFSAWGMFHFVTFIAPLNADQVDESDLALWRQEQPSVNRLEEAGMRPIYDYQLMEGEGWAVAYIDPPGNSTLQRQLSPHVHSRVIGAEIDGRGDTVDVFQALAKLPKFYYLKLDQVTLDEEDVHALLKIPNVRWLRMTGCGISPKNLQRLATSKTIEKLSINNLGTRLTDEHLAALTPFSRLRTLYLSDAKFNKDNSEEPPKVTDEGMKAVGKLDQLTHLLLAISSITDKGFQEVEKLSRLEELEVIGVGITDRSIPTIGKLSNLRRLTLVRNIDPNSFSDEGLKHLITLTKLEEAILADVNVGDETLKALGNLAHLKRLRLPGNQITDQGLSYLTRLHELEFLYIDTYDSKITNEGIKHLADLKSLKKVMINTFRGVTVEGMESIGFKVSPDISSEFHRQVN